MNIREMPVKQPRIEMLPLIDIVFLLLVFFIYAMLSMSVHHSQPVNLPSSSSVEIDTSKAITVSIQDTDENIAIFVDEVEVPLDLLSTVLKEKFIKQDPDKRKIQVFGDKSVSYQNLFLVLDRIKSSGFHDIALTAKQLPSLESDTGQKK